MISLGQFDSLDKVGRAEGKSNPMASGWKEFPRAGYAYRSTFESWVSDWARVAEGGELSEGDVLIGCILYKDDVGELVKQVCDLI